MRNFLKDERAATAIEYSLIAALIAVVSINMITSVGQTIMHKFEAMASAING